tara:strand:- start:295 stop:579 length:285 start_codon:yes stop_codon:yes gene_type:complete
MKIKLTYVLSKNKISLEYFCTKLDINDYESLLKVCGTKKYYCDVNIDEYNLMINHKKSINKKENVKKENKSQTATTKGRRRGRKPKAKSARDDS